MKRMLHMLAAAGLLVFTPGKAAWAQDNFYAGKSIDIVVGAAPGGAFDLVARQLAATMPKYIPGSPTILVRNIGGSNNQMRAANQVYSASATDGTVIALNHASVITYHLLGGDNTTFDPVKFAWLGRFTYTNHSMIAWSDSGIRTIEDARKREVIVGSTGLATSSFVYSALANEFLGTKLKLINGYQGANSLNLALEAKEIEAHWAAPVDNVFAEKRHWIDNKQVSFIMQIGDKRDPRLPDVPTMTELATSDRARQLLDIVTNEIEIGRSLWVSPDVPADRLAILRSAFVKTLEDPEFKANMEKLGAPVRYESPEGLAARVAAIANIPPDVRKQAADMFLPKT